MSFQQVYTAILGASILLLASAKVNPDPGVFVSVSFNTPWSELCHVDDLFAKRLSEQVLEPIENGRAYRRLGPRRVKFINLADECAELSSQKRQERGEMEFYVSDKKNDSIVNRALTVKAFDILHNYWENKKLSEMDAYFVEKITQVKIYGRDAPPAPQGFTELQRTWIGICGGSIVIGLIAILVLLKRTFRTVVPKPLISVRRRPRRLLAASNDYPQAETSFALKSPPLATMGIVELALREKSDATKNEEFESLDSNMPGKDVYPPDTEDKNRFSKIIPVPQTRVKLSGSKDYINANFVRDHNDQQRYIATQHPLRETVEDFWRMVLDQKVSLVVMVNEELGMNPMEYKDYFPKDEQGTERFGDIAISVKRVVKNSEFVLTTLSLIDCKSDQAPRDVTHFRFIAWCDRAMPSVQSFVTFVKAVREFRREHETGREEPIVVHCSDGQRFTGIFIAVDIGVQSHEENKTSLVDVFELSKRMRADRNGIISSAEHYNYIYEVLCEHLVNGGEIQDAKL